ncbi:MAG: DUF3570 domain-containing protein, partial [Deltaproteobacteria bacterium]
MQLTRAAAAAVAAVAIAAAAPAARADGEIAIRGAYYKEKATRVQQPMIDARLDVGDAGQLDAHFLVDVITSASVAAGNDGQPFSEYRYEAGGTYLHRFGDARVGAGVRASTEPDYRSVFVSGRGEFDFADRNTTLAIAAAAGFDRFDNDNTDFDAPFEPRKGAMTTTLGSLTLSQVLSPVAVASLTYDAARIGGDQENLYRQVSVGDALEQAPEAVPNVRWRHAIYASARAFVEPTRSTLIAGYRYYFDTWEIRAHTPEIRLVQDVARDVSVRLRYRYHRQSAAFFYRDIYDRLERYRTDDPKLGA